MTLCEAINFLQGIERLHGDIDLPESLAADIRNFDDACQERDDADQEATED